MYRSLNRGKDLNRHLGSCLCGEEVIFEIAGDFDDFYLCHCSRYRKDSGSAHAANLFSTSGLLRWITGEDKVTCFTLPGTQHKYFYSKVNEYKYMFRENLLYFRDPIPRIKNTYINIKNTFTPLSHAPILSFAQNHYPEAPVGFPDPPDENVPTSVSG